MTVWEYKVQVIESTSVEEMEATLNVIGLAGWELITITPIAYAQNAFIFKRPKDTEAGEAVSGVSTVRDLGPAVKEKR